MGSCKSLFQFLQLKRCECRPVAALLSPRSVVLALQVNVTVLVTHGATGPSRSFTPATSRPLVQTVVAHRLSTANGSRSACHAVAVATGAVVVVAVVLVVVALQLQEVGVMLRMVLQVWMVVRGRQQVMMLRRMVVRQLMVVLGRTALDWRTTFMGNILHYFRLL